MSSYHANDRLHEFISRDVHPGHRDGVGIAGGAWRQEIFHHRVRVVPGGPSHLSVGKYMDVVNRSNSNEASQSWLICWLANLLANVPF